MKTIESSSSVLLKILFILILVLLSTLAFRANNHLIDHPFIEDGYYSLSVARNVALGNGITADQHNLTNGFQPLYTFISAPAFMITGGERYSALRIITILTIIIFTFSAMLAGSIMRKYYESSGLDNVIVYWLTALVYISSLLLFIEHFNGLETGFLLFLILLSFRFFQDIDFGRRKDIVALGFLTGLTVLARVDSCFLAAGLMILLLIRPVSLDIKKRRSNAILFASVVTIISLPWFLYNYIYFGSIIPSSGLSQISYGIEGARIARAFSDILQILTINTYTADRIFTGLTGDMARLAILAILIVFIKKQAGRSRLYNPDRNEIYKRTKYFGITLIASYTCLAIWYITASQASHFYLRYFSPLMLIGVGILARVLILAYTKYGKAVTIYCLISSSVIALSIYLLHDMDKLNGNRFYKDQLSLILKHVKKHESVAASQSGTIGFFLNDIYVINIDGKVNTEALKNKNNILSYLEKNNIKWFCDWKYYTWKYLGSNPEKNGWVAVDSLNDFFLYRRI